MREIKFRGWHSVKKKMFSAEEMAEDQLTLLPTGSFINVHSVSTRLSEIYPRDKFVPLQYTGLKDKNGKEIYEGDILKYDVFNSVSFKEGEVLYQDGSFMVTGDIQLTSLFQVIFYLKEPEVIGNIYENPELLT